MPIVFALGRVVFVAYFIYLGLQRLMSVAGTAEYFSHHFTMPPALASLAAGFESMVGLSAMQIIALLAGAIELAAGLLMAFNVGTRVMALVLIAMTGIGIYYGTDLSAAAGGSSDNLHYLMTQFAIIGGLIVFVALGSWRPGEPERPSDV